MGAGVVAFHLYARPAGHPDLLHRRTRWTALFPWASMSVLRGDPTIGPLVAERTPEERTRVNGAQHPALHVAQQMTATLIEAPQRDLLTDMLHVALDQNIQLLVDYLGGCERIRKTPLPFAYVVHLRRALIIYCLTLPFALVETFGWFTTLDVLLVANTFLGIEEIGVEIEGPFGHDDNDLPMHEIREAIAKNVYALAGMGHPAREAMPEGL